ncbi:hypothetical protein J7S33_26035, partial [Saccharothrix algeriensis]
MGFSVGFSAGFSAGSPAGAAVVRGKGSWGGGATSVTVDGGPVPTTVDGGAVDAGTSNCCRRSSGGALTRVSP